MRAKERVRLRLAQALDSLGLVLPEKVAIDPPKDPKFGDMASNAALILAREARKNPKILAEEIRTRILNDPGDIERIDIAGPGFLNFFFAPRFWQAVAMDIQQQGDRFGASDAGAGKRVQVEFVSANPTGPLHIGHGRGAAVGDSLARILTCSGHDVSTEYYINDAGRQMRLLGLSIFVRYQQLLGRDIALSEECYRGDYIRDLARELQERHGSALLDRDEAEALDICRIHGMSRILDGIRTDLENFRVHHQVWFSEQTLLDAGTVQKTLDDLRQSDLAYEEEGALWFRSTRFGDDKDRVLKKSDGLLTYFASDIAYHAEKYSRGFDLVVDIWGADHHGYVPRMKAAVQALGRDPEDLQVILVQLVNLLRGGEQVAMSTRAGEFETLKDVCDEVGVDAARFSFLSRKSDSHLDFDLEVVKQQTMENPVYYVQYAHARICSLLAKAKERAITPVPADAGLMARLDTPEDLRILKLLEQFPDIVLAAASSLSPHTVSYYLQHLAGTLHRYYTTHPVLSLEDEDLLQARMNLLLCVAQVLANGLFLLGVEAPERM
ncbi:MAG: arginine--tRNA ligase [Desulfovibrionales bacterium]